MNEIGIYILVAIFMLSLAVSSFQESENKTKITLAKMALESQHNNKENK